MKQTLFFILSVIAALSVQSQQSKNTVSMTVNGNKNLQIAVDGRDYNLNNSTTTGNKTTFAINNLEMGQHTLEVTRTEQYSGRSDRIYTIFNLRSGFDMLIKVNENGSLELIETKKTGGSSDQAPMSNTDFTNLLKTVRNQQSTNGRRSVIANAFNNTNNYFTTFQVEQLLQLVNSESYRLQLAKLSYRGITDPENFRQLYDLFNSQASKNELEDYISAYNDANNTRAPMPDSDFNTLYQDIKKQWPASTQMNSLTNAFNNTNNYFSTYQAGQLIQIVFSESNRLQLAKLSYRSITDTANFSQLYDLFSRQASKDELATYVKNYYNSNYKVAMSDADFTALYQDIKKQWPVSSQMNSLTNAFNNTNNYFTTYQASQLIQLIYTESNRLQLAKLSYRTITDPVNFTQVYNLLSTRAAKDELTAYVNDYNKGSNSKIAMADADFNALYQTIQLQFFPGEKMTSLTNVFNNTSNYFTCVQAKQLIQLVSLESNRLQLAKLSYRTITDRSNFNQLYDLLNSQASRNELDAYVKAYKD